MRKKIFILLLATLFLVIPLFAQDDEEEIYIEKIEVKGNNRISTETIIYYMESREGDLFNRRNLRTDFQNLWNTGFFSDLKIKAKDGVEGKIVIVEVEEQQVVNQVRLEGLQDLSSSEIVEAMDKSGISIKQGTYLNMGKVAAMKQMILDFLDVKGYKAGTCDYKIEDAGKGRIDVIFDIKEGKNIVIEEIRFTGNKQFSDWDLRKAMEELGNHTVFSFLGSTDIYNEIKFFQDRQKIRDLYWGKGYLDVRIYDPIFETVDGLTLFNRNKEKRAIIVIPIEEGEQYKINEVTIEGNTEFDTNLVRNALPLRKGDVYNHELVKGWMDFLKTQYGRKGYVMLSLKDNRKIDSEKKIVDLNLEIKENDVYYINRINISGNNITNDEVVRRQMLVREGDVFDNKLLELSIRRIQQLGYFEPNLELIPKQLPENKVDLDLKVKERGATNINFGVAYSEIEGFFGNFSFETKNFFGTGNSFGISAQFGRLAEVFSLDLYDPWFLGKMLGFGASIFYRSYDFPGYIDKRIGGQVNLSYPILTFMNGSVSYNYQVANIEFPEITDEDQYDPYQAYYSYYYRQLSYSRYLYPEGKTVISSVANSVIYNTVDHPLFPHEGWKTMLTLEYGGGPLGGNIDFIKGTAEVIKFIMPINRNIIGVRAKVGWIESLSDERIPVLERFFLGGDRSIRVLPIRSVGGEIDENGIPTGGTKMFLLNLEYQVEISGEMRLVFFFDAGNAFSENQSFDLKELRKTAGIEARIFMPVFNVPIRLIFGFNLDPKEYEKSSDFQFSMGMMF